MELSKNEQERLARHRAARIHGFKKIVIWIAVIAIIGAAIYGLVWLSKKAAMNKPGEAIPELSRDHIPVGSPRPQYNSNPPTSGPHYPESAAWGVYDKTLPDEQLLHNLEHGGIWISYKDAGDKDLADQLKSLASKYTLKVIMEPRPADDSRIAVAAWGRLLKLDHFDKQQIRDFINAYINRGPEDVPY